MGDMTEPLRIESIGAVLRWQPKHLPGKHDQYTHGSWAQGRGGKRDTRTTKLKAAVADAEARIRDIRDHEELYAFDANGNQVLYKVGGENFVKISTAEGLLLKGATFTHNHPLDPDGSSFSVDDIRVAQQSGAAEVRAVGGRYTYRMKVPFGASDKTWLVEAIERDIYNANLKAIDNGTMSVAEANAMHYHEVWTRFGNDHWAKTEGWSYERTERVE
jgi:hypothetical protein